MQNRVQHRPQHGGCPAHRDPAASPPRRDLAPPAIERCGLRPQCSQVRRRTRHRLWHSERASRLQRLGGGRRRSCSGTDRAGRLVPAEAAAVIQTAHAISTSHPAEAAARFGASPQLADWCGRILWTRSTHTRHAAGHQAAEGEGDRMHPAVYQDTGRRARAGWHPEPDPEQKSI